MLTEKTLQLFKRAASELPAYKYFLAGHGIDPKDVTSVPSLKELPLTDKKNYLTINPIQDLVWKDALAGPLLFCATSGSTGDPYYFPRTEELSEQYSYVIESYIKHSSYGAGKTLVLIGFGMGVWIGGVITQRAFEVAAERANLPIALLPTGYNKVEIFKALRRLAPDFDQTIIVGYPPFIKELVDEAPNENIELTKLHLRFLFAAESFTETFRNYVCTQAGVGNPLLDTLNIYGSADVGAMAYETPLSILIRRLALEDPLLLRDLFGQIEKTPTLAQYNPDFIEFEAVDHRIILSADSALPLIRYSVGDHGGVLMFDQIKDLFRRYNIDLETEVHKASLDKMIDRQQPFVYVYERADLSVSLHGITIYPEFVKEALLQPGMPKYFTERFTMSTKNDIRFNQFLQINLELQEGVKPSPQLELRVKKCIQATLINKSSEFAEVTKSRASSRLLQVVLWEKDHPRYFSPGTKQKWVEKA